MTIVKKIYKCDICGKEYSDSNYIRGHITIDHSDDNDLYSDHDAEYKEVCSECTSKIANYILRLKEVSNLPEEISVEQLEELDKVLSFDWLIK